MPDDCRGRIGVQPVVDYCTIVRSSPAGARLGVYATLDACFDEIAFQTAREPETLNNDEEVAAFLRQPEPVLFMIPANRLEQLPLDLLEQVRVIDARKFLSHVLNHGVVLKHRGYVPDDDPLALLTNRP